MESERFDHLAKTLAASTSRRRLLGCLLGGTLAGLGLRSTVAQAGCPRDKPIRCGDDCADLRTNPHHCGRCGQTCAPGYSCYAGRCLASCPNGFDTCGGTCHRPCTGGQVFDDACTCVCPDGHRLCHGHCIPDDGCCTTAECPDDGLTCTTVACVNHTCVTKPHDDRCDDGSDCHVGVCDPHAGCVFTPSDVLCGGPSFAHLADQCQAPVCAAGTCVAAPAHLGHACDDGDPCTAGTTCQADGRCGGGGPVTCPDCQSCSDGACVADPSQDGTGCVGSDRCLTGATCQAGVCTGGEAVVCNAPPDQCHHATGTCNPATGICSYPPVVCNSPGMCEVQTGAFCYPDRGCVYAAKQPFFQPCFTDEIFIGICIGNVCIECIPAGQPTVNQSCASFSQACCSNACDASTGRCL